MCRLATISVVLLIGLLALAQAQADDGSRAEAGTGTPPKVEPQDAIYTLILDKAVEGGKPLTIYLDRAGGKFVSAFATATTFNKSSHEVDASNLKIDGRNLAGDLKVTVHPDPWMPTDHKPVSCSYAIEGTISGTIITGRFKGKYGPTDTAGKVSGGFRARGKRPALAVLELHFEHPLTPRYGGKPARWFARFAVKDGKVQSAQIIEGATSPTHFGGFGRIDGCDLRFVGDTFAGSFTATLSSPAAAHTFAVEGKAIGEVAAGRWKTSVGEKPLKSGMFLGTFEAVAAQNPADCLYTMMLHNCLGPGQMLLVYLDARDGKFRSAFAVSTYNRAVHDIDASQLKIEGRRLTGMMKVTMMPDDWIPRDHSTLPCTYALDVDLADVTLSGTFKGKYGSTEAGGHVTGDLEPRTQIHEPIDVWLKLINKIEGITIGYVFLGLSVRDGKTQVNKFPIPATVNAANLKIDGHKVSGTIAATVDKGQAQGGHTLTLTLDGRIIGNVAAGNLTARVGDNVLLEDRFLAVIGQARKN